MRKQTLCYTNRVLYGGVPVSTGVRLIGIAAEWRRYRQTYLNAKTNLANVFGGNRAVAYAA